MLLARTEKQQSLDLGSLRRKARGKFAAARQANDSV